MILLVQFPEYNIQYTVTKESKRKKKKARVQLEMVQGSFKQQEFDIGGPYNRSP